MMTNNITRVKNIKINKFRGLANVTINFGNRITLICGKNGTSKSSILGILAQVFSFSKDYVKNTDLDYNTLTGNQFKSKVSEHFRLSKKFDTSGTMDTEIFIHDGYTGSSADFSLKLYEYQDRDKPRPIVRGNTLTAGENSSRNATHPVIYLSLNRLTPIPLRAKYTQHDIQFLTDHEGEFVALNNKLLSKRTVNKVTATTGSINSAVVHSNNYDQDSVSAGEDNAGQILLAIFSFKKLKAEYPDYKGGLLLIDEADAGLFPAAQAQLIKILTAACKDLNIQVVMTSHSPTMIEEIYNLSKKDAANYRNIYLSDTYGAIANFENFSWPQIYADLHVSTIKVNEDLTLPEITVYFEDKEAYDLFSAIVKERNIRRIINTLKDVALGCSEYIKLVKRNIPEFSTRSIIVLDGDVENTEKLPSIIKLPGILPPDQLIFEFLYNLPPDNSYWKNKSAFTKPVFLNICDKIITTLEIDASETSINLKELINAHTAKSSAGDQRLRTVFKEFSRDATFNGMVTGTIAENPYREWVKCNPELALEFNQEFKRKLQKTLSKGHGIDPAKLTILAT